jgi:hypothetical protein
VVNGAAQDRRRLEAIVCDRSALQKHGWRSKIDSQGFFASSRVGVGNSQRAIVDGSQSAIEGNAIRINMRMIWAMMNGVTPRKIVSSGTSLVIPLITNTFMLIGCVIRPSSTTITTKPKKMAYRCLIG